MEMNLSFTNNGISEEYERLITNKHNVDINRKLEYGSTELIDSSRFGRLMIVKILIKNRADIECKNNWNDTALSFAVCNVSLSVVQHLIKNGSLIEDKYLYDFFFKRKKIILIFKIKKHKIKNLLYIILSYF